MVDQIRTGSIKASEIRVSAVARSPAATRGATAAEPKPAATLAQSLAERPPVNAERVAQIKQALANGTFPLSSSTIADRLIALRYEWMADDAGAA